VSLILMGLKLAGLYTLFGVFVSAGFTYFFTDEDFFARTQEIMELEERGTWVYLFLQNAMMWPLCLFELGVDLWNHLNE